MVNEDRGSVVMTVELDNPSEVPFTVVLTTQNGTATGNVHVHVHVHTVYCSNL